MKKSIIWFSLLAVCTTVSFADKKALVFSDAEKEMMMFDTKGTFVLPPAGALANSLSKDLGNIDWSTFIKSEFNPKTKLGSNLDKALLLGIKGADAYFLAISRKSSELKDVSMSINFLLNKIKIENKSINGAKRKNELKGLASKISQKQWDKVLVGISKLKDDINSDFEAKDRSFLQLLNSIGGWLEGYRLAVEGFKFHYKAEATITLLQDSLIIYLLDEIESDKRLDSFSKKTEIVKILTDLNRVLEGVKGEIVSKSELEKLSTILSKTTIL